MSYQGEILKLLKDISKNGTSGPDFQNVDRELAGIHETGSDELTRDIGDLLDEQVGPVFDEMPRVAAMYSTFMFGVIIGQRLTLKGVLPN